MADPAEPVASAGEDHLAVLGAIVARLVALGAIVQPLAFRFTLARVGRELAAAVRCQRDPEGLAGAQWREMSHRKPWLTRQPAPVVLADGRVL